MRFTTPLLILIILFIPLLGVCQPGNPGGGTDPDVPITGIELLLGGGAILGIRTAIARFKSKKQE